EEAHLALEAITIDYVSPGEQQPESDHNFKAEDTEAGVHLDRHWRHARGWFSYDLNDPKKEAKKVRITYSGGDSGRRFDILVNEKVIATVTLDGSKGNNFYTVEYDFPKDMVEENDGILTIKFEAKPGSIAGGVYGVRLMR
ncbi:MAG: glycosyl hydrolase, partial [Prolixibacteraceae bacterium]|nr:glycosyl hydrolase [Prolixibacteraceae bacterium]